jgi:two-component sensor histidine kinase
MVKVRKSAMPFSDENHPLREAQHLKRALHAAGVALWSWNVDTDAFAMDEQAFSLWGLPPASTVTFEHLSSRIHPADRDRVRAAFTATRALVGAYEIDFRILLGQEIRWISARGLGNDEGLYQGRMSGVFLDVTGRKQAEEGHELLAGEMSHRVKNLLAIAAGLTSITSRSAASVEEMARELTQRLTALGRAHDLVRPLADNQGRAALLGDLIAILLVPYDDTGAFSGRVRVAVPRMGIGEQSLNAQLSSSTSWLPTLSNMAPSRSHRERWMSRGPPPRKRSVLFGRSVAGLLCHRTATKGLEASFSTAA